MKSTFKFASPIAILTVMIALVLASCNLPAGNTQLPSPSAMPSPGTTDNSTQVPPSPTETTWKTYTNTEVGFSIQYPANWQEQDLPDENAGQRHHIALTGPEGGVELLWGIGFGGACPDGYQAIPIAKGNWPACHSQREDGTDLWSLASQEFGNTTFAGFVYTNDTTAESQAVVLKVIATLSFP